MSSYLMLELRGVSSVHRYSCTVHMELAHNARAPFGATFVHEFWAKRPFFGTFSQSKESDEDVPLGILIRKEGLPAAVRRIVSAQ
jgi:hypothetical protein